MFRATGIFGARQGQRWAILRWCRPVRAGPGTLCDFKATSAAPTRRALSNIITLSQCRRPRSKFTGLNFPCEPTVRKSIFRCHCRQRILRTNPPRIFALLQPVTGRLCVCPRLRSSNRRRREAREPASTLASELQAHPATSPLTSTRSRFTRSGNLKPEQVQAAECIHDLLCVPSFDFPISSFSLTTLLCLRIDV